MLFSKIAKVTFVTIVLLSSFLVQTEAQAEVQVKGAWVRLLPPMSKMTAAYMTLVSDQEDRLMSVSSDMAKIIEIHQSKMEDGVMSMQEVKILLLPKNEPLELKPQSYHLMVMGLQSPLKEGEIHQFTLEFEQAGKVLVQVPVINP
ncbi:MAG: copper(I)-binding protein [Oleiphilaceae bacterium]|jgi:copper(I)-binding protein